MKPTNEPTTERVDFALDAAADAIHPDAPSRILAAEVRRLQAESLSWQGNCQRMADQNGELSKELGDAGAEIARLRAQAEAYHIASLGPDGKAVIDAWWSRGAGIKDPSLGDLQAAIQLHTDALRAKVAELEGRAESAENLARIRETALADAHRRADIAEARAERMETALTLAIPSLDTDRDLTDAEVQGTYPTLIKRRAALRACQAALAGQPEATAQTDAKAETCNEKLARKITEVIKTHGSLGAFYKSVGLDPDAAKAANGGDAK